MISPGRFAWRAALVTGGGSGIGKATVLRLAAEGAMVAIVDIRPERAHAARIEAESLGARSLEILADVTKAEDNDRMVAAVMEEFGRLDVLVTSAGIGAGGTVDRFSEDQIDHVLDVDLKSVVLSSRAALPAMRQGGGGAIVHVSSIDGVRGSGNSVFSAAKGGVVGLTLSMAAAHAKECIRVNCVCPGVIETPLTEEWLSDPSRREDIRSWHPMGRLGQAEEVAAPIAFLASDEASFITGAVLAVDGGYIAAGRGW